MVASDIKKIIEKYAHDYRDMKMSQITLEMMVRNMTIEIVKKLREKQIDYLGEVINELTK